MLIRSRIKFRHLQCFLEIVRQKSLTKAGEVLALTQPTVSKTLSELEEDLGVVLIKRNREGVVLTDQGREFYRYAGVCVSSFRNGFDAISRGKSPTASTLRIGSLPNVSSRIMPEIVTSFRKDYPDSHISLITESNLNLLPKLRHGEIEMIIGRLPERDQIVGFSFEPLYHERQLFVVRSNHPLLNKRNFSLQKIIDYPFIMHGHLTAVRHDVDRFIASLGLPHIEPAISMNSPDFARHFAYASDAIWCVPRGVVEREIVSGTLAILPIDTSALRTTIGITTRADQPLEGMAQFFAETVRSITHRLESD